ncbi:histidine 2-aminobutanoyltransferase [Candidatus Magnetomoraceae bacterium gMMP-15]
MHDINYFHNHELTEHDFFKCCKNCQSSVKIIKPHIIGFAERIKKYTKKMLAELSSGDLYRLYQILDDLAHINAGDNLSKLILSEADIRDQLPIIRSYYAAFFSIHERHLAEQLFKSSNPWESLRSFPLYPRYKTLVKNQIEAMPVIRDSRFAFIGCGPVPMSLILMGHLYDISSIGLDISSESVEISKKVIKCLGLEKKIEIIQSNESHLKNSDWDVVLVAALAEPKARIFQCLREIMKKRKMNVPVIFRTYTGMRAVLYEPVQFSDIKGFKIVKQIPPIGRVNNTTIFAELI